MQKSKRQLSQYMQLMEGEVHIKVSVGSDDVSRDMLALVEEISNDVIQHKG